MPALAAPEDWPDYLPGAAPSNAATLLEAASGTVRTYCGWSISEETVTGVYDADGSKLLLLPTLHLTSVTQVEIDSSVVTDYAWSQMGALARDAGWPKGFRRVTVTYTHGYAVVPAEVQAIVFGLAGRGAVMRPGERSRTVGAVTHQWADGTSGSTLQPHEASVLSRYRLPPS